MGRSQKYSSELESSLTHHLAVVIRAPLDGNAVDEKFRMNLEGLYNTRMTGGVGQVAFGLGWAREQRWCAIDTLPWL